jgi:hypothetical protein
MRPREIIKPKIRLLIKPNFVTLHSFNSGAFPPTVHAENK